MKFSIRAAIIFPLASLLFPFISFADSIAPVPGKGFIMLILSHVVFGLVGIGATYAIAMALLKKIPNVTFLKWTSLIAVISFFTSWITSAFYYVKYYGGAVKTAIKAGAHPWAHTFFMETKEHVFLFLPFLSLLLFCAFWFGGNRVLADDKTRRTLMWIAVVGSVIGIFSALAGVIISGSA